MPQMKFTHDIPLMEQAKMLSATHLMIEVEYWLRLLVAGKGADKKSFVILDSILHEIHRRVLPLTIRVIWTKKKRKHTRLGEVPPISSLRPPDTLERVSSRAAPHDSPDVAFTLTNMRSPHQPPARPESTATAYQADRVAVNFFGEASSDYDETRDEE